MVNVGDPFRLDHRISRRRLGGVAMAAAAVAAGPFVGAAGPRGASATRGSGKVKLVMEVSWQGGVNYAGTVQQLTEAFLNKHWTSQHPGVELTTYAGPASNGNSLSGTGTIAAILAGQGPDIVTACCSDIPGYIQANILLPLDGFIRRDNVDMAMFPFASMDEMTTPAGTLGLPDYAGQGPLYFNQGMFDDLGLKYPDPNWTYEDALKVWQSVSGVRKGKPVYGMNFHHYASGAQWVVRGWGGAPYDATHTKCLLDSSESVSAYEWYVGTYRSKIATNGLGVVNCIAQGQAAFSLACCGSLQSAAITLANNLKWDLIAEPAMPKGVVTYSGTGLIGMNNASKNSPDLVWDLLKFVTLDPRWQRYFNAQLSFQPPNNNQPQQWQDWITILRQVAPVLRTKNLESWLATTQGAWARAYYRYDALSADAIWTKYEQQMEAGTISVGDGLQTIARQIDAMESAGAAVASTEGKALVQIQKELAQAAGAAAATFPAPAETGFGSAFASAPQLVKVSHGVYTITGDGSMAGGSGDDATFACAAETASRATYSCRLVSIAALDKQTLHGGAKIGLMARGDLSDNSPAVFIDLDGPNGVHFDDRPIPGITMDHQRAGSGGLLGASGLVSGSSSPVPNWLLKPLWLRLVRSDATWTAFTSLDGTQWQQAGNPVAAVQMAGCWVGLVACSNNAPHAVQAVFDHVTGFAPNMFVSLGG